MKLKTKVLAALGFCLLAVIVLAQNVPIHTNQGGTKRTFETGTELEMQSGSTLDIQAGVTVGMPAATQTGDLTLDDGAGASPGLVLKDGSDGTGTFSKLEEADTIFTPSTTTESLRVVTGNLRVGNGTADVTVDGEDAYVEGTLEVDGAARLDGALDLNSTANISGAVTLGAALIRTSQEYQVGPGARVGASAGWLLPSVNLQSYTLPASEGSTATLVIPVSGLHIGDTITGWKLVGQAESAGNTCEIEGDLRKLTTAAGAITDASVGAIVGLNLTADTAIAAEKTGLAEVVAADETFYILLSGTTAASTDFDIQGCTVTVTQN